MQQEQQQPFIQRVAAQIEPGANSAEFRVHLPTDEKYHMNIISLHARVKDDKMEYRMRAKVNRLPDDATRFHSAKFVDPFAVGKTPVTFGARMAAYVANAEAKFNRTILTRPSLGYNALNPDKPDEKYFFVTLPPGCFAYSPNVQLWGVCGFDPDKVQTRKVRLLGGGATDPEVDVYGFFNDFPRTVTIASARVYENERLSATYEALGGGAVKDILVEMGWKVSAIYPLSLGAPRGTSRAEAAHALSELVDRVLKIAGLDQRSITVTSGDDGELLFATVPIQGNPVTLELSPRFPLDEFLQSPNVKLIFPMDDDRTYSFRTRQVDHDYLDPLYPLSVVARNVGTETLHFIEKFGKVPLLAHMNNSHDCCRHSGVEIEGADERWISVYFIDKELKRVVFKEASELYIVLELSPVSYLS